MEFEWDETKNGINKGKHQVGFEVIVDFDWDRASLRIDDRRDYGEERNLAYGPIAVRGLHVIAFTMRGDNYRIISVRPFGRKDYRYYEPR
jgi:uncharacterized DUF497 family protein